MICEIELFSFNFLEWESYEVFTFSLKLSRWYITGPVPQFFRWSGWIAAIKVWSTPLKRGYQILQLAMVLWNDIILIVCKAHMHENFEILGPLR